MTDLSPVPIPAGLPAAEALKRGYVAYVPQSEEVDWNFPVLVEDVAEGAA